MSSLGREGTRRLCGLMDRKAILARAGVFPQLQEGVRRGAARGGPGCRGGELDLMLGGVMKVRVWPWPQA